MRKDPTLFRLRFQRWKNGELVYDAGLPKYEDGKDPENITADDSSLNLNMYTEGMKYISDYVKSDGFKQRWNNLFPKQDLSIVTQNMLDTADYNTYTEDDAGNLILTPLSKLIALGLNVGSTLGIIDKRKYNYYRQNYGKATANAEALSALIEDSPFLDSSVATLNTDVDYNKAILRGPWYSESLLDGPTVNINPSVDYKEIAKNKFGVNYSNYINPFQIGAHELAHLYRYAELPELWKELLMPELYNKTENDQHDSKSDERLADQKASRFINYKGIGFDSRIPDQEYTKQHLMQYKKYLEKNNIRDRFLDQVGDDNFIKSMNVVAQNKEDRKQLHIPTFMV